MAKKQKETVTREALLAKGNLWERGAIKRTYLKPAAVRKACNARKIALFGLVYGDASIAFQIEGVDEVLAPYAFEKVYFDHAKGVFVAAVEPVEAVLNAIL